ncbi:unnamed protein product [Closterium sp. NIES-53]
MADNTETCQPISRKRSALSLECNFLPCESSNAASDQDLAGNRSQCGPSPLEAKGVASEGIVAGLVSRIERGELVPPLKRAKKSVDEGSEQADFEANDARGGRVRVVLGARTGNEAEESALLEPREGPGERDAEVKLDRENSDAVENMCAVVFSNIDKSAIEAENKKLEKEDGRQLCLLEEKGKMTWEQQWMVAAVDGVVQRLVDVEEGEMTRLLVAQQRQLKANAAVSRAGEAALDARQAHGNLEEAQRQAVVELEESQAALQEATMRLGDLETARQQHEEFLEKRVAQQKLVVERALKQLQNVARIIATEESEEAEVLGEGVTKLNSTWIQLAAEQRKLHELLLTCSKIPSDCV